MNKSNRYYSNGQDSGNQYEELAESLAPTVELVRSSLLSGEKVSDIICRLEQKGHLGVFSFICIFFEATDASIGELKGFGRWWLNDQPLDLNAIDTYAAELNLHQRVVKS